jgi:hypothetical protein
LVQSAINGKPALQFDGVSKQMSFPMALNGLTGMTIIMVSANSSSTATGGSYDCYNSAIFWDETANWGTVYLSPFEGSVKYEFGTGQANNLPSYTRPSSIGSAFTMTEAIKNGTSESLYVGGQLVLTQTGKLATIADIESTGNLGVGYLNTHFAGQIAEVLVYNRALTSTERQQVEQYLNAKYFQAQAAVPPIVTAETPASGATGVAASSTMTATFSKAMTASSVASSTFTLAPPGGSAIAASVSYNSATNAATLTPTSPLANNTTYAATILGGSSGVKDSSGNAMAANVTWTFTTVAAASSGTIPTTGLGLWLKANTGLTLNGSSVSQWADQSGHGNNATQAAASAQPTLASNAINGLPAVNFGGSADMQFNLPVNGLTGMTIFMVDANGASFTGGSYDAYNAPLYWDETADWGTVYLSPFEASAKWEFGTGQTNNLPSYTRPASIGTAFTLTDVVKNGTTENLYVGGVLASSQTGKLAAIADTQSQGNLGVGYLNTHWNGKIAEVIVYTVALTDAQREQVEQYLETKYGL